LSGATRRKKPAPIDDESPEAIPQNPQDPPVLPDADQLSPMSPELVRDPVTAPDGGYWMIGLRRGGRAVPAGLFGGVRWSSAHALADTVASLAPLDVGFAATLRDVDEAADLRC